MSIYEKLLNIQTQLKAPKSQYNKFGNYNYRSCEDILEALKPLMKTTNTTLHLSDEIELISTRFYVVSTATLIDNETSEQITSTAYAREDETKKGMDGSQVTGTASSYARKYALNGLLCLSDTKDSDHYDNSENENKPKANKTATKEATPPAKQEFCNKCKSEIKATYSKKQNKTITAIDVKNSMGGLCTKCFREQREETNGDNP